MVFDFRLLKTSQIVGINFITVQAATIRKGKCSFFLLFFHSKFSGPMTITVSAPVTMITRTDTVTINNITAAKTVMTRTMIATADMIVMQGPRIVIKARHVLKIIDGRHCHVSVNVME